MELYHVTKSSRNIIRFKFADPDQWCPWKRGLYVFEHICVEYMWTSSDKHLFCWKMSTSKFDHFWPKVTWPDLSYIQLKWPKLTHTTLISIYMAYMNHKTCLTSPMHDIKLSWPGMRWPWPEKFEVQVRYPQVMLRIYSRVCKQKMSLIWFVGRRPECQDADIFTLTWPVTSSMTSRSMTLGFAQQYFQGYQGPFEFWQSAQ